MKVMKLLWFYLACNEVVSFWASAIVAILDFKSRGRWVFIGFCKSTWRRRATINRDSGARAPLKTPALQARFYCVICIHSDQSA